MKKKMAPKKSPMAKLSPAMASRIRTKAKSIMAGLPRGDKDSAAGAAT